MNETLDKKNMITEKGVAQDLAGVDGAHLMMKW